MSATFRMVNTRIWNDTFVNNLDPSEKLLFVYLLTNEHTNYCGIYEIPVKVIAMETGLDASMIPKILAGFGNKVLYLNSWICVINFPKYQKGNLPKVRVGIENALRNIPKNVLQEAVDAGYPIDQSIANELSINCQSIDKAYKEKEKEKEKENNFVSRNGKLFVPDSEQTQEPKKKSKYKKKEPSEYTPSFRVESYFLEMCRKELQTEPLRSISGRKMINRALGRISEEQCKDKIQDWFSKSLPEQKLMRITHCFSDNEINGYIISYGK